MQNFSWHVFKETGNIEAYLLYKEMREIDVPGQPDDSPPSVVDTAPDEAGSGFGLMS